MRNSNKTSTNRILAKGMTAAAMATMVLALPLGAASAATPDDSGAPNTAVEKPTNGSNLIKPIDPIKPVQPKPATALVNIDCEQTSPASIVIHNHLNEKITILVVAGDFVLGTSIVDSREFSIPLEEDKPTAVTVKASGHGEFYNETITLDCKSRFAVAKAITQTLVGPADSNTDPDPNTDPTPDPDPNTDPTPTPDPDPNTDPTPTPGDDNDPKPETESSQPPQQNPETPSTNNAPSTNDTVPSDDSSTEHAAADDITLGAIGSDGVGQNEAGKTIGLLLMVLVIAAVVVAGAIGATAARARR